MKNTSQDSHGQANHRPLVSRPIPRRLACLILSGCVPLLLGAECSLETCDIFNCDTLPFIEELLASDEHTEDGHDDEDGQMDMDMDMDMGDGEEHVDDDAHDDEEDEQMDDDEVMHDEEEEHMEDDSNGDIEDEDGTHDQPDESEHHDDMHEDNVENSDEGE